MNKINFMFANSVFADTKEEVVSKMLAEHKPMGFCYDKEGQLYKFTKSPNGISIEKVDGSIFSSPSTEIEEGFVLTLPKKIPLKILLQIISFFKSVCSDSGDEVFARIYFDKETGEFFPFVPEQRISKANVTYNITDERFQTEDRYLFVLDIHSHNTMGAFFSGTDDRDEQSPGKIFAVVGKLDQSDIAYKIRTFTPHKKHVEINLFDVFEKPEIVLQANTDFGNFEYTIPDEELIRSILKNEVEYPEEWKDQIQRVSYGSISKGSYDYGFGYNGGGFGDFYSGKFSNQRSLFDEDNSSKKDSKRIFKNNNAFRAEYEDDDLDVDDENFDLSELSTSEDKYEHAKEVASEISDLLCEIPDMDDPAFITGLKEGLIEQGLDYLIERLSKEE